MTAKSLNRKLIALVLMSFSAVVAQAADEDPAIYLDSTSRVRFAEGLQLRLMGGHAYLLKAKNSPSKLFDKTEWNKAKIEVQYSVAPACLFYFTPSTSLRTVNSSFPQMGLHFHPGVVRSVAPKATITSYHLKPSDHSGWVSPQGFDESIENQNRISFTLATPANANTSTPDFSGYCHSGSQKQPLTQQLLKEILNGLLVIE